MIVAISAIWCVCFGLAASWSLGLFEAGRWPLVAKTLGYSAAMGLVCLPVAMLTLWRRSLAAAHIAVFVPVLVFAFLVAPIGSLWGFNVFGAFVCGTAAAYVMALGAAWRFLPPRGCGFRSGGFGALRAGAAVVVAALLIAVTGYAALAAIYFTGHPTIKVDYLAPVNAPIAALAEAERAWPGYLAALRSTEVLAAPYNSDGLWNFARTMDDAVVWVEAHREAIDQIRAAAAKPGLGYIIGHAVDAEIESLRAAAAKPRESGDGSWGLSDVEIPYLSGLRQLSYVLGADARVARLDGESERYTSDIEAMLGIAGHVREAGFVIGDLVSLSMADAALDELRSCLSEQPAMLSDEDLARLAAVVESFRVNATPLLRVEREIESFEDLVQRVYTDDGQGNGRMTPTGMKLLAVVPWRADDAIEWPRWLLRALEPLRLLDMPSRKAALSRHRAWVEEAIAESRIPYWLRSAEAPPALGPWETQRYRLVHVMTPALQRAIRHGDILWTWIDGAAGAIACERHRRASGDWPRSWDDITEEHLDRELLDPMDGQPLRIAVIDGGLRIYSIGEDFRDNGGDWLRNRDGDIVSGWPEIPWARHELLAHQQQGSSRIRRGDWVLFPTWPETED